MGDTNVEINLLKLKSARASANQQILFQNVHLSFFYTRNPAGRGRRRGRKRERGREKMGEGERESEMEKVREAESVWACQLCEIV